MSRLNLFLFGAPTIELDGQRVEINRRKAVALLAYLAVTHREHSRETLASLLWMDVEQSRAYAYLRTLLWTLHKSLGDEWLEIEQDTVRLRPKTDLWVDVWRFCALTAASERTMNSISLLTEAANLYRDDFMAGFSLPDSSTFEEWQFFERERLRRELSNLLAKLVRCHIQEGNYEAAIPQAQRWLALDTFHEPAHRELMRLYDWTDQRSLALRQYRQCKAILEAELGVEPEAETVALFEAIQQHSTPPPPSPTTQRPQPSFYIPQQDTPLIGRERECIEITRLLEDPACRLLTLTGPGGIGKTRVALQVAADIAGHYANGAFFVGLSSVTSTEFLLPAIADAVRFSAFREGDPKAQLLSYLSEKHMLLVVDNFDHLVEGAGLLGAILSTAPSVKILVTSRERLHLQEEWIYEIQGLPYPASDAESEFEHYGAVALFCQSARRVRPDFTLSQADKPFVQRICQIVEGMPLGVELAAAWLQLLSCQEIAEEIERSVDFLAGSLRNLPPRHRSMRAVFESSWEQLTDEEQDVLSQLSIFRGGFERAGAEAVAGATLPLLLALVNKSLLYRNAAGRYDMHELLRQFALEKLISCDDVCDRHLAYYVTFLQKQETALKGEQQIEALNRIEADIDNVRTAWEWAITKRNFQAIRALLMSLTLFYLMRSRLQESRKLFGQAIERLTEAPLSKDDQGILAQMMVMQAVTLQQLGHTQQANELYHEAMPVVQSLETPDAAISFILLGMLETWPNNEHESAEYWVRRAMAIFETAGDRWSIALALRTLGDVVHHQTRYSEARQFYQESLSLSRVIGDRWGEGAALRALGEVAFTLGEHAEAEHLAHEAIAVTRTVGDQNGVTWLWDRLAGYLAAQGRYEEAQEALEQSISLARQLGNRSAIAQSTYSLGVIYMGQLRFDDALALFQQCLEHPEFVDARQGPAWIRLHMSRIALVNGNPQEAVQLSQEALLFFETTASPWGLSGALYFLGEAFCAAGDLVLAEQCLIESLKTAIEINSLTLTLRHLVGVAYLWAEMGRPEEAIELLAMILHHPVSWQETKNWANRLWAVLSQSLPSDSMLAAAERGKQMQLRHFLQKISIDEEADFC